MLQFFQGLAQSPVLQHFPFGGRLLKALVTATYYIMPSWMLDDLVLTFRALLEGAGDATFGAWLHDALSEEGTRVSSAHVVWLPLFFAPAAGGGE